MAKCPYCGKTLVVNERYCWHCENDLSEVRDKEEKPQCFIATAIYGENAYETNLLRKFRDKKLKNNFFGAHLINLYYLTTPGIAKVISKNKYLKKLATKALSPIIKSIENRVQ